GHAAGDGAHQVAHEQERALQDADEVDIISREHRANFGRHRGHARRQGQQRDGGGGLQQVHRRGAGCWVRPRAPPAPQPPNEVIWKIATPVAPPPKPAFQPAAPCGACRQVILEVENKQNHPIKILLQGESETVLEIASGKDLLPLGFDGGWL
ncbi:MAG TPA: hypothetical protein PKC40_06525, partial [Saprospiraceae bacterium]|nr:hypothetical protein [Saprospiraceae bacterium]